MGVSPDVHQESDLAKGYGPFATICVWRACHNVLHPYHGFRTHKGVLMADDVTQTTEEHETLTEELLQRLLESSSPEAYLAEAALDNRELSDYLFDLLDEKNLTRAEVARGSAVNPTFVYQIFNGKRNVARDNAIKIAFGLHCTLRETQRLLRHAGASELWCKNRRDAIIIYCIEHGYDRARTDDELYRMGEPTLVAQEG